jgi:two-component system, NarL family, sensor histidine kinase EvgS
LVGDLDLVQLQATSVQDPELTECVQRVQNSTNAINSNLIRVLELARLQDVSSLINVTTVNLFELANLIGKLYEAQLASQGLTLKILIPANKIAFVKTDFDLMFQIIPNLVSNATKYRRPEPVKLIFVLSIT